MSSALAIYAGQSPAVLLPVHADSLFEIRKFVFDMAKTICYLKKQFADFSTRTDFLPCQASGRQHNRIDFPCRMRAHGNAAHTGDTDVTVHFLGLSISMACTGRSVARTPQPMQSLVGRHSDDGNILLRQHNTIEIRTAHRGIAKVTSTPACPKYWMQSRGNSKHLACLEKSRTDHRSTWNRRYAIKA